MPMIWDAGIQQRSYMNMLTDQAIELYLGVHHIVSM